VDLHEQRDDRRQHDDPVVREPGQQRVEVAEQQRRRRVLGEAEPREQRPPARRITAIEAHVGRGGRARERGPGRPRLVRGVELRRPVEPAVARADQRRTPQQRGERRVDRLETAEIDIIPQPHQRGPLQLRLEPRVGRDQDLGEVVPGAHLRDRQQVEEGPPAAARADIHQLELDIHQRGRTKAPGQVHARRGRADDPTRERAQQRQLAQRRQLRGAIAVEPARGRQVVEQRAALAGGRGEPRQRLADAEQSGRQARPGERGDRPRVPLVQRAHRLDDLVPAGHQVHADLRERVLQPRSRSSPGIRSRPPAAQWSRPWVSGNSARVASAGPDVAGTRSAR
jgi:hypothetical protein